MRLASAQCASQDSLIGTALLRALDGVGVEPFPVVEKPAQRHRDLAMLVSFITGRERAGIAKNASPGLPKFVHRVARFRNRHAIN